MRNEGIDEVKNERGIEYERGDEVCGRDRRHFGGINLLFVSAEQGRWNSQSTYSLRSNCYSFPQSMTQSFLEYSR